MHMVRHHHERIQFQPGHSIGKLIPHSFDHLTGRSQMHVPIGDFPEQEFSLVNTDRNEIGTASRVIVTPAAGSTGDDVLQGTRS